MFDCALWLNKINGFETLPGETQNSFVITKVMQQTIPNFCFTLWGFILQTFIELSLYILRV
jgi:hypothetical protein